MVIPDREDEDGSTGERLAHSGYTTVGGEVVGVAKGSLLSRAEGVGDRVTGDTGDSGLGVGDDNAVLDVLTADLGKSTTGSTVGGDELSHDGELLAGVDGLAGSVEAGVAHAVRVEVAAIGVAHTTVPARISTVVTGAEGLARNTARMGGVGS